MVSVNRSPRMFQHPTMVDDLARILEETGLEPGCLKLEITEGIMMQDGAASLATLARMRDLGVKLRAYAEAKIPQYIVIDLVNNVVRAHRGPTEAGTYVETELLRGGQAVRISAGGGDFVEVPVERLLA